MWTKVDNINNTISNIQPSKKDKENSTTLKKLQKKVLELEEKIILMKEENLNLDRLIRNYKLYIKSGFIKLNKSSFGTTYPSHLLLTISYS